MLAGVQLLFLWLFAMLPMQAEAEESQTEVILHKILYTENEEVPDGLVNSGDELTADYLMGGRFLNGAEFTVFDVTLRFHELTEGNNAISVIEAQKTIDEEAKAAREEKTLKEVFGDSVAIEVTKGQGQAKFNLDSRTSNGKSKAYLFAETDAPEKVKTMALNIVLVLPLYQKDGGVWTDPVHLYPKNFEYARDPFFYKHAKDDSGADLGPLEGAQFVLYKVVDGVKWYLHMNKYDDGNVWVEEGSSDISIYTSDKNGLVTTGEHHLPEGIYYFEEIASPNGYFILDEARKVQVTVPGDPDEEVTIQIDGSEVSMSDAVIYNLTDDPNDSSRNPGNGRLPETGEVRKMTLSFIGLLLVAGVVLGYRKKVFGREKEWEKD